MRVRTIIIIAVVLIVLAITLSIHRTSSFICKPLNGQNWICNYNLRR